MADPQMTARLWRSLFFFVLGFGLAVSGGMAFAETIAATNNSTPNGVVYQGGGSNVCQANIYDACNAKCSSVGRGGIYQNATYDIYTNGNCYCQTGGQWAYGSSQCNYVNYSCPSSGGWTVVGSSCTRPDCVSPETRQPDGSCKAVCPVAGSSIGSSGTWYGGGGAGLSQCISGCTVNAASCVTGFGAGGTQRQCQGPFVATGESCSTSYSGTNGIPATNGDPATAQNNQNAINCLASGQGYGTVNGVTVCSGAANTSSSGITSNTTTDPINGTTTSTTTKQTTCTGDSCTTTSTTTTSGGAGGGGTTTGTTTQPKADFCKDNPQNIACAGQSEQEDYCKTHPNVVGCKELGAAPAGPDVQSQNKGVGNIIPTTGGAGSCPATVALPRGAEFSFDPMCDLATGVRPVVLAIAWLIAGGMIFAWFKS